LYIIKPIPMSLSLYRMSYDIFLKKLIMQLYVKAYVNGNFEDSGCVFILEDGAELPFD
ncbi:hypothetical protein P3X46_022579, partial [Hevea brasiliensis]